MSANKKWYRQLTIWILLIIPLLTGIGTIITLNDNTSQNIKFLEKVITAKYEGSLSQNKGFLTMLTAELANLPEVQKEIEDKKVTDKIEAYLKKVKDEIQNKISQWETTKPNREVNVKNLEGDKSSGDLVSWMQPETLSKINYQHLNLKRFEDNDKKINAISRPYLHSADHYGLKSFVLIPKQLVSIKTNDHIELSNMVKREIIFSKLVEPNLIEILKNKEMEENNIWQVYFIPLSGSVRIRNREGEDPLKFYKDILPGTAIFSDRPYFKQTLKEEKDVRKSNPYIDSAGNGLIITYSILIRSEKFRIVGMIGADRKIAPFGKLKDSFKKLKLGSPMSPKGFQFITHAIDEKACNYCHKGEYGDRFDYKYMGKIFEKQSLPMAVAEVMERSNTLFKSDIIARLDFRGKKSTVYCVLLGEVAIGSGKKEVAFFHFDPGYTKEKSSWLLISYVLSMVAIIIPVVLAISFFILRRKDQRTHIEVVSHLNGGLVIVDSMGHIIFNNKRMSEMVRIKNLDEQNFYLNLLTAESMDECKKMIEESKTGFEFSGQIKRSDETIFPAIISNTPINYPGVPDARMSIIIPSEQLERAMAVEFIHGFTHALKTPVHSILLLADRLRRKSAQKKFDYYYSLMRREVDEFDNMVTNLLRFSKLEVEEITLNKVHQNMANLLRSSTKPFREKTDKAGITLKENIPGNLPAKVDSEIIKVIVNNLLENALKYTEEGDITIDARIIKNDAVVTISDTGIGIPPDEAKSIFFKFYRGHSPEVRAQDGIGIGLYVSAKYAKLHDGSLDYQPGSGKIKNKQGGGSTFILKIPRE